MARMRSLLFTLWLKANKEVEATKQLIEELAVAQFDVIESGGGRIVRSSVAGKSFDFELPANWSMTDLSESLREAYKKICTGGASGGEMTEDELQDWVLDSADEVTDTLQAVVSLGGAGGRV